MANYANNTTPLHPQKRVAQRTPKADLARAAANYLATVNLSAGPHWSYALKTLPRPKGAATHAIITEYHLPRASMAPQDVLPDKDGVIWFSEFGDQAIGAKTGKVTEYPLPSPKPNFPTGTLDLEPDGQGNYWLAMMFQTGLAKFDPRTKTFQTFPIPAALNAARPGDRSGDRIPAAASDQHPPHLHRQFDAASDLLGRQQSSRRHHQAGINGVAPAQIIRGASGHRPARR